MQNQTYVTSATQERPRLATFDGAGILRIGRDSDNDIVLPDLWVSRKHAEIRKIESECHIVDLSKSNGLHHNGVRVARGVLAAGDRFSIGRHEFLFDGTYVYAHDDQGPISVIADDLTIDVGKSMILDDVSFALRRGTLLGIVGPSGCGKSTLLKAMTGVRPATRGELLFDGKELYRNYSELRYRIGLVPQDDVVHRQLTVRGALHFAASLRFASDVSRKQRRARVNEVLELLGLRSRSTQRIDTLSGGQRKRASVALELLTEPSLLALDEPTSGLDPALDKEVMRELRLLADRGRTVVVVTHSVLHLDLCDYVLVMCLGGRMGFFGPPDELLDFFESEDYADVFDKVTYDAKSWAQIYRVSDIYRRYVGEVARDLALSSLRPKQDAEVPTPRSPKEIAPDDGATMPSSATSSVPTVDDTADPVYDAGTGSGVAASPTGPLPTTPSAHPAPAHPVFADASAGTPAAPTPSPTGVQDLSMTDRALHPIAPLRQFLTLSVRMISVILSDRGYATFLVGLPLALALLSYTVPGDHGLAPDPAGYGLEGQRLLVVFVIGAAFMGLAVAIREIVNESTIYRRERAVGLSPTAYLASKLLVFAIIDTMQVGLFVFLATLMRSPPPEGLVLGDPLIEIVISMTLVAIASTVMGLLASALVRTAEQTTPILVVSVMAQLVLSGGLFVITGQKGLEVAAWLDPSRWGFSAAAATTNLVGFPFPDPAWEHTTGNWWRGVLVLIMQIVVLAGATRYAMRRFEPGKG